MILTAEDRKELAQFFPIHFNRDSWELGLWIDSSDTIGVVKFMADEYDVSRLRAVLLALQHLRDSAFDERELHRLIFSEFGADKNPTNPGVKQNFKTETLQAWVEQMATLLDSAIVSRLKSQN